MKEKVLVTGAAGFIGSHLVEALLEAGHTVRGIDLKPIQAANNLMACATHPNFQYIQGDITKKEDIEKFYESDANKLFHLASIVGVEHYLSDPLKLIDVIVVGTRILLEFARRDNMPVIYVSTSEVYGRNPKIPWSETDDRVLGATSVDRWSYSSSKAVCEHMLYGLYRQSKLPFTILRFFNAYGPRQEPRYVVSQSIYKILRGEQPICYNDGHQTRCFTYISDIIKGILAAAHHPQAIGEAFNIGNPTETNIKTVIATISKLAHSTQEQSQLNTKKTFGNIYEDVDRRVPDVRKAKELLNWEATVPLSEGIQLTLEWAKQNKWWLNLNEITA